MKKKIIAGVLVGLSSCAVLLGLRPAPQAIAHDPCPASVGAPLSIVSGRLVDPRGASTPLEDVGSGYQLRHVAGRGNAVVYVRDRAGHDRVVVSRPGKPPSVVRQPGEVFHPVWGPHGELAWGVDDALVLRSRNGDIRRIDGPRPGGLVMAPAFDRGVVAAVASAPTAAVPEDDWSDDVWRLVNGHWSRLTHFPADHDRWTAVRTLMAAPDGSIEFVVVRGRGSATAMPRFSLWWLLGNRARLIQRLPGEQYLAGFTSGGQRLWNVPDRSSETWLIETNDGIVVGCGAVAVDPMDAVDPDRTGHAAPPPAAHRESIRFGDPVEPAILVGDFNSEQAAAVTADRLVRLFSASFPVDIARGGHGSDLVAPDHWAVLVRLDSSTDGTGELASLRARAPDLASHSWIVAP